MFQPHPFFHLKNPQPLDPTKDTVAVLATNVFSGYSHIFGFMHPIVEWLKERYNVVYFGSERDADLPNFWSFSMPDFKKFKAKNLVKAEDWTGVQSNYPDHYSYNHGMLYKQIEACFENMPRLKHIFLSYDAEFHLMLQKYPVDKSIRPLMNEFHDYVGNDVDQLEKVIDSALTIGREMHKWTNPNAFAQVSRAVYWNCIKHLYRKNEVNFGHVHAFVIDPTFFRFSFVSHGIPLRCHYFGTDCRGSRNFKSFPIAELQHLVYDKAHEEEKSQAGGLASFMEDAPSSEKDRLFFFMGTILQEKGVREQLWSTYLRSLNLPDSDLYIPLKANGIYFRQMTEKQVTIRTDRALELFEKTYREIEAHPMHFGHVTPNKVIETVGRYRYTLIMRCVSHYDSLNYRPVLYAWKNVLPLLDPQYDPAFLQIPEHLQKMLVVKDAEDIERAIEFFEKHPGVRDALLENLREHFRVEEWLKDGHWKKELDNHGWLE